MSSHFEADGIERFSKTTWETDPLRSLVTWLVSLSWLIPAEDRDVFASSPDQGTDCFESRIEQRDNLLEVNM